MNRRQFLSTITAAPAIISSKGIFRGSCDVWVPAHPDIMSRLAHQIALAHRVSADELIKSYSHAQFDRWAPNLI